MRCAVVKRDGATQAFNADKILARIKQLTYELNGDFVDAEVLAKKIGESIYDGVKTTEVDTLAAQTAAYMATEHPDWSTLAARLAISKMHKETDKSFYDTCAKLHGYVNPVLNEPSPLISDEVWGIVQARQHSNNDSIHSLADRWHFF